MSSPDRRASPRERLRVSVEWDDGRRGWTRDISPGGLYVIVPGAVVARRWYSLRIEYPQAGLRFDAIAQVMRIEAGVGVTGVALRLHRRRFRARDPALPPVPDLS